MATALNAICFEQPHWRVKAKGYDTDKYYNIGQGESSGGIFAPVRVHLNQQNYHYRFVDSTKSNAEKLGGGWWVSFDTYNAIKQYAKQHKLDFTNAARLFLAVPMDWNRFDRILKARLVAPLDAYTSEGKVAITANEKYTPPQNLKVPQLYIPGLVSYTPKDDDLYNKVWTDPHYMYTHSGKVV